MFKRIFDFIVSLLGIVVLSPLLPVIGLLIKLNSPGPIFFQHARIGLGRKEFNLCKFRTMIYDQNSSSGRFDPGDKSRITSIGKMLRRYKIDEIPQLINVLKGDMSLVGPRAEVKKWTEFYPEKWDIVHTIRPGITDEASIEFRNEEELLSRSQDPEYTYLNSVLPRKLDLNIDYVVNHTFCRDVVIILKTIKAVLFHRG